MYLPFRRPPKWEPANAHQRNKKNRPELAQKITVTRQLAIIQTVTNRPKMTMTDPLNAARALRSSIKTVRHEIQAARRLPTSIVDKLIETGLCRLTVPESLGGRETEPLIGLDVYGSWLRPTLPWPGLLGTMLCQLLNHYLSNAVRAELFANSRRLFTSSTRPSGRAVMQQGGFRVSGRWSLVSGCELADWILLMCVITTDEGDQRMLAVGVPEMRMAYVPKGSYKILDTWHAGGLRGTS